MTDREDRLADLETHLESHRQRLADHEQAVASLRERLDGGSEADGVDTPAGGRLAAGGLLAALGVTVVAGTASADPQGQVGTEDEAVSSVHVAALDGPVTDGQRVTSIVGDGLAVEDGTLTLSGNK